MDERDSPDKVDRKNLKKSSQILLRAHAILGANYTYTILTTIICTPIQKRYSLDGPQTTYVSDFLLGKLHLRYYHFTCSTVNLNLSIDSKLILLLFICSKLSNLSFSSELLEGATLKQSMLEILALLAGVGMMVIISWYE
jgi:hypothetical protein